MNRHLRPLTAEDATLPAATTAFQRGPAEPLRYPLSRQFLDWLSGVLDRPFAAKDAPVDTPWLQALRHEFGNAVERERRDTHALLANLDDRAARAAGAAAAAERELVVVEGRLAQLDAEVLSDAPTTAAEQHDSPEHRLARRRREQAARRAPLAGRRDQLRAAIEAAGADQEWIRVARQSQWNLMLARCHHLLELGNRRAARYTRALTRRLGGVVRTPTLQSPVWLALLDVPDRVVAPFEPAPVPETPVPAIA